MKLIIAIIRQEMLEPVQNALSEKEVYLMTVSNVHGCGRQRGYTETFRGGQIQIRLLPKLKLEIAVNEDFVKPTIDAIIIAFNVVPDEKARALAQERGVEIRRYDIIYRVSEDLKAALEGMLKPEEREKELGAAWVQKVFHISRIGSIAGCRVMRGTIRRESQVRVRVIREIRGHLHFQ